jgi:glucose/arabinose dehydrogenase
MKASSIVVAAALGFAFAICRGAAPAGSPLGFYTVQDIAAPPGVVPVCNALGFLPDGRLVAAFDHGEVCFYNPKTAQWHRFAEGLHTPLGLLPISDREILVCQKAELTRLVDTTGRGVADTYSCVTDQWGMSGNYHEFAYGPVRDAQGRLFVALGSASAGGAPRHEVRGTLNPDGRDFGPRAMYSVVPYRGWVVQVEPGGNLVPVAAGFRQPNGIVLDPDGRLFVTDNQGDWVGTSKLHLVEPGGFYGQPSGLVWRPDWKGPPSLLALDQMRHEAVVLFPHAILANSPGQPVFDETAGKFGPYAGQMFVTEYNIPRILRVMLEKVAGETQGAVAPFFDGPPLRAGGIRLAFAPDGSLWLGETQRPLGWPAAQGIQRIAWNGRTPFDVLRLHLTESGFEFTFTRPVDRASAESVAAYVGRRYYYLYQAAYGSPRTDIHELHAARAAVSSDGLRVRVDLPDLKAGYIYEFNLTGIKAADGAPLVNPLIAYTANRLQDGSKRPVPQPAPTGESRGSGKDLPPGSADD